MGKVPGRKKGKMLRQRTIDTDIEQYLAHINEQVNNAIFHNKVGLLEELLGEGAIISQEHMKLAIKQGFKDVVNILAGHLPVDNIIFTGLWLEWAVKFGQVDILTYFIDNSFISDEDHFKTIISLAIQNGQLDLLKFIAHEIKYIPEPKVIYDALAIASNKYIVYKQSNQGVHIDSMRNILDTMCWLHMGGINIEHLSSKRDIETQCMIQKMENLSC